MHNLFIDLERLKKPYCGLGQFSKSLGQALLRNKPNDLDLTLFVPKKATSLFSPKTHFSFVSPIKKSIFHLNKLLYPSNIDLWHTTHQDSEYFPFHFNGKIILTIHDLNFLRQKNSKKVKARIVKLQKKIDKATHVTTISNFVKHEILTNFDIHSEKITVIYNGVDLEHNLEPQKPNIPNGDFLFSIGQIIDKKNFHTLIEMMLFLPNYHLVLAGENTSKYAEEIYKKISEYNLESRVHLIGTVSDQQRLWLFNNCKAFVFPSLSEGFGIPPIEAMSVGKPVFLSRLTSLPEVAKEHGYYWDNFGAEHMAERVVSGLDDFNASSDKIQLLKNHAKTFNWDEATKQFIHLYKKILS